MAPLNPAAALVSVLLIISNLVTAQNYIIGTPNVVDCSAVLYDTGGPAGSGYGPGQQVTSTICPENAGSSMALNFVLFDLDTLGAAPLDHIAIFDGPSINSPLLGMFEGNSLQGQVISASAQNSSGCLTVRFNSNAVGTGTFLAGLQCGPPCSAPIASFAPAVDTLRLCFAASLAVDASPSQAAAGRSITQYEWTRSGAPPELVPHPLDTLVFPNSGAYRVWLRAFDDLGCPSAPTDPVVVLVGAPPSFAGTSAPEAICAPATFSLFGQAAVVPLSTIASQCLDLGAGALLPDDIGAPFEFLIQSTSASPGAVVGDAAELGEICLSLEHSFMGDLVIELECPNGQSAVLHQQGGGGTFLGQANDANSGQNPSLGTCYTYCFSATPEWGTWVECSQTGSTPNVEPVPLGFALLPGTYTSVEPLDQLVGCPVNGTWTLRFIDLWAGDNGYLCSWCTGFASLTDSSSASLSPTLNLAASDSASWSGMNVIDLSASPNATSTLSDSSIEAFTFSVIDSYGCSYDTTLIVHAVSPPTIEAGADVQLCADSVQLGAVMDGLPMIPCIHTLVLTAPFDIGWQGTSLRVAINNDTTTYTLPMGFSSQEFLLNVTAGASLALLYDEPQVFILENRFQLFDQAGILLYDSGINPVNGQAFTQVATCGAPDFAPTLQWMPSTGLSDPTSLSPLLFTTSSGWQIVTVSLTALPNCSASDSIWVESAVTTLDLLWNGVDSSLCASIDTLTSYAWWVNGSLHTTTTEPCLDNVAEGAWYVVASGASPCLYVSPTTLVCPTIALEEAGGLIVALGAAGTWEWTLNGAVLTGVVGPFVTSQGSGTYVATVTTALGCVVSASLSVETATSVNGHEAGTGLRVFPVPTAGMLTIQAPQVQGPTVLLTFTDMSGRAVFNTALGLHSVGLNHTLTVPLPPGSYILQLLDGERLRTARVVIE